MKKSYTLGFGALFMVLNSFAQPNWQVPSNLSISGFWDMDTLNNKLYVSDGLVNEYDGSNVKVLNDYNNSLNTANKSKSAVSAIDGKLYCGAKDFNTIGEGIVHYYENSAWSLLQTTRFSYNGSYKIRKFVKFKDEIYMSGLFAVPKSTFLNIAKWNGTDWTSLGRNFALFNQKNEIFKMEVYDSKLYLTEGSNVWSYDGATTDSIFNLYSSSKYPYSGLIYDMVVYKGSLYLSGSFMLEAGATSSLIVKYDGNNVLARTMGTYTSIAGLANYEQVRKMAIIDNLLLFIAKRKDDQGTYLVKYDGQNITELGRIATKGDFSVSPGSEITNYNKMMVYKNNLYIGGNFAKIGGKSIQGFASAPLNEIVSGIHNENIANNETINIWSPSNSEIVKIESQLNQVKNLKIYNQLGQLEASYNNLEKSNELKFIASSGIYLYEVELENSKILKGKFVKTN